MMSKISIRIFKVCTSIFFSIIYNFAYADVVPLIANSDKPNNINNDKISGYPHTSNNRYSYKSDGNNYIKIKGGIAQPTALGGNTQLSRGNATFVGGGVIGRKFMQFLSADFEYNYTSKSKAQPDSSSNSWTTSSNSLLVNLNIELLRNFVIMPYLKGGMGVSFNKSSSYSNGSTSYPGKTTPSFAWQGGMGLNFQYSNDFGTELEYLYANRGKVKTQNYSTTTVLGNQVTTSGGGMQGTIRDHIITFGLKVNF
jgi:opacity protein-like surface antigen